MLFVELLFAADGAELVLLLLANKRVADGSRFGGTIGLFGGIGGGTPRLIGFAAGFFLIVACCEIVAVAGTLATETEADLPNVLFMTNDATVGGATDDALDSLRGVT